jgi:hypothetical protein
VAKNIAIGALAKRGKLELTWAGKSSLIELEYKIRMFMFHR